MILGKCLIAYFRYIFTDFYVLQISTEKRMITYACNAV